MEQRSDVKVKIIKHKETQINSKYIKRVSTQLKVLTRMQKIGTLIYYLLECKIVQPVWNTESSSS